MTSILFLQFSQRFSQSKQDKKLSPKDRISSEIDKKRERTVHEKETKRNRKKVRTRRDLIRIQNVPNEIRGFHNHMH